MGNKKNNKERKVWEMCVCVAEEWVIVSSYDNMQSEIKIMVHCKIVSEKTRD